MKLLKKSLTCLLVTTILISGTPIVPNHTTTAASKVYIAPYSGKKYHSTQRCRGLNRARYTKGVSLKYAKSHGYTKCKICY